MAKKRFTDDMDDLFGDSPKESTGTSMSLFPEEEKQQAEADKKGGKGFAAQLDALLAEAFESTTEAFEEVEEAPKSRSRSGKKGPRKLPPRRATGLDLLIRRTGDEDSTPPSRTTATRRLTVALKKEQLDKLKRIAKDEGVFLKDLMNKLVDRYLEKYEK